MPRAAERPLPAGLDVRRDGDHRARASFEGRGEALPSLGAVGRLSITSHAAGDEAATIRVAGGQAERQLSHADRGGDDGEDAWWGIESQAVFRVDASSGAEAVRLDPTSTRYALEEQKDLLESINGMLGG